MFERSYMSNIGQPTPMELVEQIQLVWGNHNDFKRGGFPYVAFVIKQDVADMEADKWDEKECIEELADVCINSIRMIYEQGYFPSQVISERLRDHQERGTDHLVEKYQRLYEESRGI